eukprot:754808-Hanusia_phi.AAC.5
MMPGGARNSAARPGPWHPDDQIIGRSEAESRPDARQSGRLRVTCWKWHGSRVGLGISDDKRPEQRMGLHKRAQSR